ncbi:uncharacterized protein LOC117650695 [Thrips palmi]|uniref:Uncharacterized protein LOC117650695 n=1 Tax=Thrips palmi TaxID=161013 RepID=A0A6P8ZZL8_THRPL|nr:uncharacterized protein LOC117650695 [Thrips palmi]
MTERLVLIHNARRLDIATVHDAFRDHNNMMNNLPGSFGSEMTYHSLYPSVLRARENSWPQLGNISELCDVLENPLYTCITADNQFADNSFGGAVRVGPSRSAILFMSEKCKQFLKIVSDIFILCTCTSLYTIGTHWEGNVIQIASILMETDVHGEDYETLVSAFSMLRTSVGVWHYSKAFCGNPVVARAFHDVFGVEVKPALKDYINDIQSFVNQAIPFQSPSLLNVMQLCCALAIVPKDMLQMGINLIVNEAERSDAYNDSLTLFNYLERVWIRHPHFTMCDVERTTFGSVELERKLFKKTFEDFYSLIRFINQSLFKLSHKKIDQVMRGQRLPSQPSALVNDTQISFLLRSPVSITTAWNLLKTVQQKISHIV